MFQTFLVSNALIPNPAQLISINDSFDLFVLETYVQCICIRKCTVNLKDFFSTMPCLRNRQVMMLVFNGFVREILRSKRTSRARCKVL